MAKTAKEILEGLQYEMDKLSPFATNAMRSAIIRKSIDGRTKAIDAPYCEKVGVSKERLQDWRYNTDTLYDASVAYSKSLGTDEEDHARNELWSIWKRIIRVGEEDALHPNMFVREKDVENLRVLAAESTQEHIPGIGFVPTLRGKEQFRGIIEIRLALRIAGNATLSDLERDTVKDYRKAVKVIDSTRKALEGYVTPQGEEVPSLYKQLEDAQAELAALVAVLKKTKGADVEKLTKRNNAVIKNIDDAIDSAQERLEKALKVEMELKDDYAKIVARLDSIEGAVEEKPEAPAKTRDEIRNRILAKLAEYDAE